ncbi:MAG: ribosome-binding factor A [Aquificaceae bacterium]
MGFLKQSPARVDLSEDMRNAKVYFTTIPEGKEKEVEDGPKSVKNYIKAVLIKRLRVKSAPELSFKFDIDLKSLERIWEKL